MKYLRITAGIVLAATAYFWIQPLLSVLLMPDVSAKDLWLSGAVILSAYILGLILFRRVWNLTATFIDIVQNRILPGYHFLWGVAFAGILTSGTTIAYFRYAPLPFKYVAFEVYYPWMHPNDEGIVLADIRNETGKKITHYSINESSPLWWDTESETLSTHFWLWKDRSNEMIVVIDGRLLRGSFSNFMQAGSKVELVVSGPIHGQLEISIPSQDRSPPLL
jgi:hypothetical protein